MAFRDGYDRCFIGPRLRVDHSRRRGQNVGGGDTAMEEATFRTRFARSLTVVHRRSTLRASQVMQSPAFSDDKISFSFDTEIAEVKDEKGMLAGVVLRDVFSGATRALDVTGLFIAIGRDPRTE